MTDSLAGKAQTVLGPVDPDCLGITSCHEHILSDMAAYYMEPEGASEKGMVMKPLTLDLVPWVRAHRFSNTDNMRLNDKELAVEEVERFRRAGGGTIIEMSCRGLCRDPQGLAYVARATGVNIVMGCSYYVGISHPETMDDMTEKEIADEIVDEILNGAEGTKVKPGVIGEIGCTTPVTANEAKVMRASAAAQRRTGAPMDVHPPFNDEMVLEVVKLLQETGAVMERTMISHVDNFDYSLETRLEILQSGCYIGYDNFGNLGYPHMYLGRVVNLASDYQRIQGIMELVELGYIHQILLGQDTVFKDQWRAYGGYGYAHMVENVAPLMIDMGMTADQVETLMVDNPRRFLTFGEPTE